MQITWLLWTFMSCDWSCDMIMWLCACVVTWLTLDQNIHVHDKPPWIPHTQVCACPLTRNSRMNYATETPATYNDQVSNVPFPLAPQNSVSLTQIVLTDRQGLQWRNNRASANTCSPKHQKISHHAENVEPETWHLAHFTKPTERAKEAQWVSVVLLHLENIS